MKRKCSFDSIPESDLMQDSPKACTPSAITAGVAHGGTFNFTSPPPFLPPYTSYPLSPETPHTKQEQQHHYLPATLSAIFDEAWPAGDNLLSGSGVGDYEVDHIVATDSDALTITGGQFDGFLEDLLQGEEQEALGTPALEATAEQGSSFNNFTEQVFTALGGSAECDIVGLMTASSQTVRACQTQSHDHDVQAQIFRGALGEPALGQHPTEEALPQTANAAAPGRAQRSDLGARPLEVGSGGVQSAPRISSRHASLAAAGHVHPAIAEVSNTQGMDSALPALRHMQSSPVAQPGASKYQDASVGRQHQQGLTDSRTSMATPPTQSPRADPMLRVFDTPSMTQSLQGAGPQKDPSPRSRRVDAGALAPSAAALHPQQLQLRIQRQRRVTFDTRPYFLDRSSGKAREAAQGCSGMFVHGSAPAMLEGGEREAPPQQAARPHDRPREARSPRLQLVNLMDAAVRVRRSNLIGGLRIHNFATQGAPHGLPADSASTYPVSQLVPLPSERRGEQQSGRDRVRARTHSLDQSHAVQATVRDRNAAVLIAGPQAAQGDIRPLIGRAQVRSGSPGELQQDMRFEACHGHAVCYTDQHSMEPRQQGLAGAQAPVQRRPAHPVHLTGGRSLTPFPHQAPDPLPYQASLHLQQGQLTHKVASADAAGEKRGTRFGEHSADWVSKDWGAVTFRGKEPAFAPRRGHFQSAMQPGGSRRSSTHQQPASQAASPSEHMLIARPYEPWLAGPSVVRGQDYPSANSEASGILRAWYTSNVQPLGRVVPPWAPKDSPTWQHGTPKGLITPRRSAAVHAQPRPDIIQTQHDKIPPLSPSTGPPEVERTLLQAQPPPAGAPDRRGIFHAPGRAGQLLDMPISPQLLTHMLRREEAIIRSQRVASHHQQGVQNNPQPGITIRPLTQGPGIARLEYMGQAEEGAGGSGIEEGVGHLSFQPASITPDMLGHQTTSEAPQAGDLQVLGPATQAADTGQQNLYPGLIMMPYRKPDADRHGGR